MPPLHRQPRGRMEPENSMIFLWGLRKLGLKQLYPKAKKGQQSLIIAFLIFNNENGDVNNDDANLPEQFNKNDQGRTNSNSQGK